MADRMDGHGGSGNDEAAPGADGQGDADGMAAPQHQGGGGLGQAGDQLGQGQPGLHIPAHRVQQHQQALDGGILLDCHQLGDHMLVLGGFLALGRFHMAFDLADDGETVDGMGAFGQVDGAHLLNLGLVKGPAVGVLAGAGGGKSLRRGLIAVFFLFLAVLIHKMHKPSFSL